MSRGRAMWWLVWILAGSLASPSRGLAEDESGTDAAFEEEVETLAPLDLKDGAKRLQIEVEIHLWGAAATDEEGRAQPRTLDVQVTAPPFLENLAVLQQLSRADGEPEDAPARFAPGNEIRFGPRESVRAMRLAFDVGTRTSKGEAPPLVIQLSSRDPAVIPRRRRLELPLETPARTTGGDGVQIFERHVEKVEGGKGIFRNAGIVKHTWEAPTVENANPFSGNEAYLRLTWPEATDDLYVVARGRISGGVPGIPDEQAEFEQRPSMHPFRARFRDKQAFNIRFPVEKPNAGTLRIRGTLLAFDGKKRYDPRDKETFSEANAVATLPFEASHEVPLPPVAQDEKDEGKVRHYLRDAKASGSVRITNVQGGRRVARFEAGGVPYFGYIQGSGRGGTSFSFRLVGQTTPATSGRLTFMNFREQVTVEVTLKPELKGKKPAPDPAKLARLQSDLQKKRRDARDQLGWNRGRREAIKSWHYENLGYEPGAWIAACEAWFAALEQEAAAISNPSWEGYRGRPPPPEKIAEEKSYWYGRLMHAYLGSAQYILSAGNLKVGEAWIRKAEEVIEGKLKENERGYRASLSSLATAYSKWSEMTFHGTGDVEKANELDRTYNALNARARGETPKPPDRPRYAVDPEFR